MLAPLAAVAVVTFASTSYAQITGRKLDKLPVEYVDRPLTLPKMTLGAGLDVSFNHFEDGDGFFDIDANGANIDIGGNFGILDDIEVEAVVLSLVTEDFGVMPMSTFEAVDGADWGTARVGVTVRFLAEDVVEMAGRFRFLVDNNATIGFNAGLPIRLRAPGILRFDTGFNFTGRVNARSDDGSFGITDVNTNPSGPEPGIPFRFNFQVIEQLFIGLNSGLGVLDVENEDTVYFPLGASIGGTVDLGDDMLLDIIGAVNFPLFGLPALSDEDLDASVFSELWQIGLTGKVYVPLGE